MVYADGRLTVGASEMQAAAEEIRASLNGVTDIADLAMRLGAGTGSGAAADRRERLVELVLQAINHERLGHAEGSIARHPDGRVARRYYSKEAGRLLWLIVEPASDSTVVVDAIPDLPTGSKWEIVHAEPWKVRA